MAELKKKVPYHLITFLKKSKGSNDGDKFEFSLIFLAFTRKSCKGNLKLDQVTLSE